MFNRSELLGDQTRRRELDPMPLAVIDRERDAAMPVASGDGESGGGIKPAGKQNHCNR